MFESAFATVDNLQCAGVGREPQSEGFSPEFQVCLPYRGLFIWHVGDDDVVGDANQVLFVSGGEPYRVTEPTPDGYGELIVTPTVPLFSDLVRTADVKATQSLFVRRSRRADATLQSLRARFLHCAAGVDRGDAFGAEELLMDLLRYSLDANSPRLQLTRATRRLIRDSKLFLEAHFSASVRLSDVAGAVGASPAYLTDVFRRVEGVSLHRYLIQLRLAKALIELPHTNDLTQLALRLGFSSHSHFTAAFRRAFGCTPSDFRASTRCATTSNGAVSASAMTKQ